MNNEWKMTIGNYAAWNVCEYNGKIWADCRKIDERFIEIISYNRDSIQKEKLNITKKRLLMNQLDSFYRIRCSIVYNGYLFEPLRFNKKIIKEKRLFISTNHSELIENFGLECYDKMSWGKYITFKDVDCILLEREYWIGAKRGQREVEVKDNLIDYLTNSPEMRY